MIRIYCARCTETQVIGSMLELPEGWVSNHGAGSELSYCPKHAPGVRLEVVPPTERPAASWLTPEDQKPSALPRCMVCDLEHPADIPEKPWQRVVVMAPGSARGTSGRKENWLCPEHAFPKPPRRMFDELRGALEEGEDGLPFENPASHPAALRMLCARLDALRAGPGVEELAGAMLDRGALDRERIVIGEEWEAEERQKLLDELAQCLYSSSVAALMLQPLTGRDKGAAERLATRSYDLAAVLWTAREKWLGDEKLRGAQKALATEVVRARGEAIHEEQARAAEAVGFPHLADALRDTKSGAPDSLRRIPFICDCGCHVFQPIWDGPPPSAGGQTRAPDRFGCKSCPNAYEPKGEVRKLSTYEYELPRTAVRVPWSGDAPTSS